MSNRLTGRRGRIGNCEKTALKGVIRADMQVGKLAVGANFLSALGVAAKACRRSAP
jgi:hypothetical protein